MIKNKRDSNITVPLSNDAVDVGYDADGGKIVVTGDNVEGNSRCLSY